MIIKTIPVANVFAPLYSIWYALPSGEFFIGDEQRPHSATEHGNIFPFKDITMLKYMVKLHLKDKNALHGIERDTVVRTLEENELHHQVKILTPFGTVLLQPAEYNVIDFNSYLECINNGSFQVKFLNKRTKAAKNTAKEQLFYIQSRGISLSTALGMVSGLVRSQNTLYMLAHPEYIKMFLSEYERYFANELAFKAKMLKRDKDNLEYFFDEEEALKLNQKYYG